MTDLADKSILLTGASGFLGSHLWPQLLARGAKLSVFGRTKPKALPDSVQFFQGDCRNVSELQPALAGQEIIIHLAALLFGNSWNDYLEANYQAAHALATAADDSLKRVILVSSLAAAGPSATSPGKNEIELPAPVSAYGWSKLLVENCLAAKFGERLVRLRPPIIYGSGDMGLLPMFKSCSRGIGVSPGLRRFPVSAIHAADASQAIALACKPQANGVYHLSDGHEYDMAQFCKAIGEACGRKHIFVAKPPLAVMGLAASLTSGLNSLWRKLAALNGKSPGRPPNWNQDKYREAKQVGWLADNSRIVNELGFAPQVSLKPGLAEAVSGYRAEGLL